MNTLRTIACLSTVLFFSSACTTLEDADSATDSVAATDAAGVEDSGTPSDSTEPTDGGAPADANADNPWAATCAEDADCAAPTDYCVKMPGEPEGYCTIHCAGGNADCTYEDWTCNAVGGCDNADLTWCGPPEEIEQGQGFLVMCE